MPQSAIQFTSYRTNRGAVVAFANRQGFPGKQYNTWFVNTETGSDSMGNGTPFKPFATMAAAFENLVSNDTIYFTGKVKEQLIAPLGVTGVSIVGTAGGGVRDDDGAKWTYPDSGAVAGKALLSVRNQGWSVSNFLMTPEPTSGACVVLNRQENDTYPDASHFIASGMRFVGIDVTTTYGIQDIGGCSNVLVDNCEFYLCTTGYYCSSTAIALPLRCRIQNSRFLQNTNDIVAPFSYAILQGNTHYDDVTKIIDFTGGGHNTVKFNSFPNAAADIDPANGYTGTATDVWTSNSATDQVVFGQPA